MCHRIRYTITQHYTKNHRWPKQGLQLFHSLSHLWKETLLQLWGSLQSYRNYKFLRKVRMEFTEQHCARFKSSGMWHCATGKVACTVLNYHTGFILRVKQFLKQARGDTATKLKFHKREETRVTEQLWASPEHCCIILLNVPLHFIVSTFLTCGGQDISPLQWPGYM